jgi:hypothetical protein
MHPDAGSSQFSIPVAFTQDLLSNASQTSTATAHRPYGGYATQQSQSQSQYASQAGSILDSEKMTQDSFVTDQYLSQTSQRFTQY